MFKNILHTFFTFYLLRETRMATSISSEARRNQTSILIRGPENHVFPLTWRIDRQTYKQPDISIYRVASLLNKLLVKLWIFPLFCTPGSTDPNECGSNFLFVVLGSAFWDICPSDHASLRSGFNTLGSAFLAAGSWHSSRAAEFYI